MSVRSETMLWLTILTFAAFVRQSWSVCRPHVRLEDNLDETANLGFCPDLAGWGNTITFDDALQVRCFCFVMLFKPKRKHAHTMHAYFRHEGPYLQR